jgi:catechol 2,3-dioxygenase
VDKREFQMTSSLQLREIHLRVADLDRSVRFYRDQLGLYLNAQGASNVELAPSPGAWPFLYLTQDRSAQPAPPKAAGLFHAALLLSNRSALGSWLRSTADAGVKFDGFSDHGVSEALYLSDPDGNGLEVYVDRPRTEWPFHDGNLQMVTEPLDLPELLAAGASYEGSPLNGATWGHLHLRVSSLDRSQEFYSSALGIELTQRFGDSARFLAADGYHHHLGLNRWGGIIQPQPPGTLGLMKATFARTAVATESTLKDPDGISIHVAPDKRT